MAAPMSLTRPMLRSPVLRQLAARRLQSTAAEKASTAAEKAAAAAKDTANKAAQGLSRVTSAAGPALAGAAKSIGKLGGPAGQAIGFLERQTPLVVYYSKVALELGKYVAQNQKMAIPSAATFQTFYQGLWQSIASGSILRSPQSLINSVRNISVAQLATGGVIFAETLGFFTVGEIIGRFKLVGYRGEVGSHH
ncbi:unnamed protein product [Clonostachys rosea f. rosea IK726]|uniref:ATP synthase subunit g, mitochondrial n=3 Tax=Bionectria ochroleuca TaxID=29856 RepID=A0A8H7TN49_BIOOC|nr:unnamed protein product [Clonostachys rosea f. rosea IK726]